MNKQPDAARVERGPITEVKRFALGMAALLERQGFTIAAAELRRLHAENERLRAQRDALLEALKVVIDDLMYKDHARVIDVARAAIAKCEEST